ncbi:MAG: peptide ABC transporter substrate-binding protein, partial [Anaerolineae bacterium]|nr:peptide ABC transporter substrate-binding protein [Anaerolineae bacterium]
RRDPMGPNRLPLYQSFQRLFVERAIAIPLYYPLFTYAVRDNISGVQLSFISQPSDRFRTLADWQIN